MIEICLNYYLRNTDVKFPKMLTKCKNTFIFNTFTSENRKPVLPNACSVYFVLYCTIFHLYFRKSENNRKPSVVSKNYFFMQMLPEKINTYKTQNNKCKTRTQFIKFTNK